MNIYGKAARDVGAVRKWIIKINDRPKDGDGQCVLGKKGIILLDFISNSVTINSKMNVSTFLNLGARLHWPRPHFKSSDWFYKETIQASQ